MSASNLERKLHKHYLSKRLRDILRPNTWSYYNKDVTLQAITKH